MTELLGLDWSNYKLTLTENLKTLVEDQDFVDVTLHCEGKSLKAHKLYLSACSSYFKNILKGTNLWQHPILFLSEIPFVDLQKILEFIYCGEIQIPQNRLNSFLKSAQTLNINGLNETLSHSHKTEPVSAKKKKRRYGSTKIVSSNPCPSRSLGRVEMEDQAVATEDSSEHVVVKADPEDFQRERVEDLKVDEHDKHPDNNVGANRGIIIRNDLLDPGITAGSLYGERGRCHFCQVLCPDRLSLTDHLKTSHQPPRHSLCDNCENFFHICAITRHREKCQARYHTDK